MKKSYRAGVVILVLLIGLLGWQYVEEREENTRLWTVLNEYEANRFFPALDYLTELEPRIEKWQAEKKVPLHEVQGDRDSLTGAMIALIEVMSDHTRIEGGDSKKPEQLYGFLASMQRVFADLSMRHDRLTIELTAQDLQALQEIKGTLAKVNAVPKEVYGFDSGLTSEQWERIHEDGFLNEDRLLEWCTQVEKVFQ